MLLTDELSQKLAKRAHGILSREVPRRKSMEPGHVKQRFLGAVTHKGPLCLYDTALAQCDRIYELTDSCGLAHELLIHVLAGRRPEAMTWSPALTPWPPTAWPIC